MAIVSRKQAIASGLKRYFTGVPCKHGHIAERWTSRTTCIECFSLNQPRYRAQRSLATRDKIAAAHAAYLQRRRELANAAKALLKSIEPEKPPPRRWRRKRPYNEKHRLAHNLWVAKNRDRNRAILRKSFNNVRLLAVAAAKLLGERA